MTTYLVATLSRYVLVDAADETAARQMARGPLNTLLADICKRTGCTEEIPIRTVRPATDEEIQLWKWHHEMLETEEQGRESK